jgi:hypothetical protein
MEHLRLFGVLQPINPYMGYPKATYTPVPSSDALLAHEPQAAPSQVPLLTPCFSCQLGSLPYRVETCRVSQEAFCTKMSVYKDVAQEGCYPWATPGTLQKLPRKAASSCMFLQGTSTSLPGVAAFLGNIPKNEKGVSVST